MDVKKPTVLTAREGHNIAIDFQDMPDALSYLRNNKSSQIKRLRCFPSCNPTGHKAQGFCGSSVKVTLRFTTNYSDEDIKTGKIVVVGELCEVNHAGEIISSVLSGPITSKHFDQYTDWHNEDFSLFPATLTRSRMAVVRHAPDTPYPFTVEFKPSSWPYGWKGSRHKSPKHAFVIHVLERQGDTPIKQPVQAYGARVLMRPGQKPMYKKEESPLVHFRPIFQARSRIFEVNCCRRANGPMMLSKWAEAIKQKQVVPVAASRNLKKEQANQAAMANSSSPTASGKRKYAKKLKTPRKLTAPSAVQILPAGPEWSVSEESMAGADALAFLKSDGATSPVRGGRSADDILETPVASSSRAHYTDDPLNASKAGKFKMYSPPSVTQDPVKRSVSRSRNSKPPSRYLDEEDEVSPKKRFRMDTKDLLEPPRVPLMDVLPPPTPATFTDDAALLLTVASSASKPTGQPGCKEEVDVEAQRYPTDLREALQLEREEAAD